MIKMDAKERREKAESLVMEIQKTLRDVLKGNVDSKEISLSIQKLYSVMMIIK